MCVVSDARCDECQKLSEALEQGHARIRELEQELVEAEADRTALHAQLAEMTKLCDLQQADLDRYRKVIEASRPNHPERAPADQLQFAFQRVLEMLGADDPANDDDDDAAGDGADAPASGGNVDPAARNRKRSKRRDPHGRRPLDKTSLAVVERRVEPDEVVAAGGVGYRLIGEEVSERIALRPAQWVRFRLIRPKYVPIGEDVTADVQESTAGETARADSDGPETQPEASPTITIAIAPLPAGVWPNVMGDPSAIAHVAMSKYGDLCPLNRQQSISARGGFSLPKSTQCGWLKEANAFCVPVVDAMFDDARRNAFVIATDATSASVLPPRWPPGQRPPQQWPEQQRRCEPWHVFVFIADRDHVVFRYDREHNGAVFAKLLTGYRGNLLADAASVFDVLYREHGMTEHGCWFHCRRPFYRALETERPQALEALSLIGKLFEIDRRLRDQDLDLTTFTRLRAERASPILKLFDDWVDLHRGRVDPRGPLDGAIGYYDNQRDALHRFLADGRIRLDNNLSEQALRNLVVGLSNWVFFANETGIRWYTTFRSLIASCMLHRLNPELYLEQLLRIAPHWPRHRVLELAPKYWVATVGKLDPTWRAILERPWEPGVVVSAELAPERRVVDVAAGRAA